jgi:hypothetical protein
VSNNATPQAPQEESGETVNGLTAGQLAEAAQLGAGRFVDPAQAARLLDLATVNALGVAAAVEKIAVDHPWALAPTGQAPVEESDAAKEAEMRAIFYGGGRGAVFGPPPRPATAEEIARAEAVKARDSQLRQEIYGRNSKIFGG